MSREKVSRPKDSCEVFYEMERYAKKKGYDLSIVTLDYLADDCFLLHESRGWAGCKFWPALAMRHVLNYVHGYGKEIKSKSEPKKDGLTAREKIQKAHDL